MHFFYSRHNRKFDSAIQKNRPPIKNPIMFEALRLQFQNLWSGIWSAIDKGENFNQKDAKLALEIAEQLVEEEPLRGDPWAFKSWILYAFGRYDESLEANRHAIEIDPSDPVKWRFRASILRIVGRISEAKEAEKRSDKLSKV